MNMREMKDTGISWFPKIPVEWTTGRIKDILSLLTDYTANGSFGDLAKNVTYLDYEDYARLVRLTDLRDNLKNMGVYVDEAGYNYLSKSSLFGGEILVANVGAYAGLFCEMPKVDYPTTLAPNMFLLRTNEVMLQHYLLYVGLSSFVWEQLCQKAISSAQPKLNKTDVKTTFIPIPPIEEQKRISDYLDIKCSEFDSSISDIQHQIEVLEEYKRSVITEAVTKGLDPDVEMRDSGVQWIGDIPAHWLVEKVKFHLQRNEPRNPGDKQVLSVYREYGVIPKDSRDDNHNVTSEDTSNYKYVVPGNLVINKMKAWQGSMGVSEYEGIVSPAYFIYKFTDNQIMPKYLHYLFRSCYKDEFRRISGGIREGQWDLSPYEFSNTLLLISPTDEQNRIVSYIDARISEIEFAITEKKQQIETIEEYKKSLIFEYVTGKKEVQA